jgi:hypothetical protein
MFSLISASTVVFDREFGGRFQENSMAGKLKPSMSNRTKPGKYADGDGLYLRIPPADGPVRPS